MKIDIKYIKEIIKLIENNEARAVSPESIYNKLKVKNKEKFISHLLEMEEANIIRPEDINNPIILTKRVLDDADRENIFGGHMVLTSNGRKFLASLNDESIFNKILKEVGKVTLAELVSIGISYLLKTN